MTEAKQTTFKAKKLQHHHADTWVVIDEDKRIVLICETLDDVEQQMHSNFPNWEILIIVR